MKNLYKITKNVFFIMFGIDTPPTNFFKRYLFLWYELIILCQDTYGHWSLPQIFFSGQPFFWPKYTPFKVQNPIFWCSMFKICGRAVNDLKFFCFFFQNKLLALFNSAKKIFFVIMGFSEISVLLIQISPLFFAFFHNLSFCLSGRPLPVGKKNFFSQKLFF